MNFDGYFCVDRWGGIGLVTSKDDTYYWFSTGRSIDRIRLKKSIKRIATPEEIRLSGFDGIGCKNYDV